MSFDVFGARRDAQSWAIKHAEASSGLLTLRGFTGHEQLDEVGLVHMGGRVYDPILGRFLQADPFIQQPNNTQNLNRYSYVLNNPLNATDPSGYFFQMLVMWAVNYIATAYATTTLGAALGMALQAYSYYGYAQMAVGAIRAIEGGGTAMANFAGGMAKGYAKGMLFNGIMLGLSHLQNSASTNGPDAAKSVDNKQGSDSADGHKQELQVGDGKDPKPDYYGYKNTGLGLKMVDGKLTGTIKWFCSGSNEQCNTAINEMNDLIAKNDDFLDIKNELVDGPSDAQIRFAKKPIQRNSPANWNPATKTINLFKDLINESNFSRVVKHEFGHSLGLDHMDNHSGNFMSYDQLGAGREPNNVSFKLTQYQKDSLIRAYTPSKKWW